MPLLPGIESLVQDGGGATTTRRRRLRPVQVTSPDGSRSAVVPAPTPASVPAGTGIKPAVNVAPATPTAGKPLPGVTELAGGPAIAPPAAAARPAGAGLPQVYPEGHPLAGQPIVWASTGMGMDESGGLRGGISPVEKPAGMDITDLTGVRVQDVTGAEVPQTITPARSDYVQGLLEQSRGSVMDLLANPDVYGGELFEESVRAGERLLDEQFGRQKELLEADLARRGIDFSSIAAGNLSDLATERTRASADLIRPLLRERAQAAGSARESAIAAARGLAGDVAGLEALERGELRGERGFLEGLRGQARSQAIEELLLQEQMRSSRAGEFQTMLAQSLAASNPALAAQLLSQPGNLLSQLAMAQGQGGGGGIGSLLGLTAGLLIP